VALRKGRSVIRNVLDTESTMSPWHAAADKAGLKASAAIPIRRGGEVIATLNVYADEHHYFSVDLMRLLHELAMDASFALDRFDEETERRRISSESPTGKAGCSTKTPRRARWWARNGARETFATATPRKARGSWTKHLVSLAIGGYGRARAS
jgi:hypothetical protein